MKRFIHDKENGLDYELVGDHYFPLLRPPESPKVGAFGKAHLRFLQTEKKTVYSGLLLSGKLNTYIEDIDRQAEDMFFRLVKELAEKEVITEALKATDQMEWVQRMNAVRETAMEIVNNELIFN